LDVPPILPQEESKSLRMDDSDPEDIDWGNPSSKRNSFVKDEENKSFPENAISGREGKSRNSDNIHEM
jgi:hypothetical protein